MRMQRSLIGSFRLTKGFANSSLGGLHSPEIALALSVTLQQVVVAESLKVWLSKNGQADSSASVPETYRCRRVSIGTSLATVRAILCPKLSLGIASPSTVVCNRCQAVCYPSNLLTEWVKSWKRWVREPLIRDRPGPIELARHFCQHDLLLFDLEEDDHQSLGVTCLLQTEWDMLKAESVPARCLRVSVLMLA